MNTRERKGKKYEEIFGKEKAKKISDKKRISMLGKKRGTWEEYFGKEKADEMKKKQSLNMKGKNKGKKLGTWEYLHGKRKANEMKKKLSLLIKERKKGIKLGSLEERYGKEVSEKIKNIYQIHNVLRDIFKYNGPVLKTEFLKNNIVKEKLGHYNTIRTQLKLKGLTLDNIAKEMNVQFKQLERRIGTNESQLLEQYHMNNNLQDEPFVNQFPVAGKFIDRYYTNLNVAVEIDELHHKRQQVQDIIRENKIKEKINCEFIRIKDGW